MWQLASSAASRSLPAVPGLTADIGLALLKAARRARTTERIRHSFRGIIKMLPPAHDLFMNTVAAVLAGLSNRHVGDVAARMETFVRVSLHGMEMTAGRRAHRFEEKVVELALAAEMCGFKTLADTLAGHAIRI
ncbi:hypothetical protein V8D89_013082 [Ganoderma adspersum]